MKTSKSTLFFSSVIDCTLFFSCREKEAKTADETVPAVLTVTPAGKDAADLKLPTQMWHVSNECIIILFGYGYNSPDFVKSMSSELFAEYGSAEDGGMILPLVFPDDFRRGTKSIAAELPLFAHDRNVRGVLLLGAPENTHFGVARLLDNYDNMPVFPVFSFFSQDDVMGTEDTSDFVLDKAQEAALDGVVKNESSDQLFVKQAPDLVRKSVKYMLELGAPLAQDKDLYANIKNVTGKLKLDHYVDSDSGLRSVNHFVMN